MMSYKYRGLLKALLLVALTAELALSIRRPPRPNISSGSRPVLSDGTLMRRRDVETPEAPQGQKETETVAPGTQSEDAADPASSPVHVMPRQVHQLPSWFYSLPKSVQDWFLSGQTDDEE